MSFVRVVGELKIGGGTSSLPFRGGIEERFFKGVCEGRIGGGATDKISRRISNEQA